jgi:hypothetical protein
VRLSAKYAERAARGASVAARWDGSDALQTFSQLGVAGFTGVAIVLGGRAAGSWDYVERGQLRQLLESSLAVVLLSTLPLVLERFAWSEARLWRVSNGIACAAGIGLGASYWIWYWRGEVASYPLLGRVLGWATTPLVAALLVLQALVAAGVIQRNAAAPFFAMLLWLVTVSSVNFIYLVWPNDPRG